MANNIEKTIAKDLLAIKAVFFRPEEPFTWASGIKSPVYCDNRLTLTSNRIEGRLEKGQKVVVVEDLISTAGSVIDAVNALREEGAEVLGVASIFTYGMAKGLERLKEAGVKNVSLTNFDVIAQVAADEGYIKQEDIKRLIKFRDNPSDESWIK